MSPNTVRSAAQLESEGTVRVLVTGAGGAAGVAVIRALRASPVSPVAPALPVPTGIALRTNRFTVFGADADPHAAGLALAHDSFVVPPAHSPTFGPKLQQFCREKSIDAVLVTVAEEIEAVRSVKETLSAGGTRVWLPPIAAVQACNDKLAFAQRLHERNVATPATVDGTTYSASEIARQVPGPWIIKPRQGRGSRDVFVADSLDDLSYALRHCSSPIVQTRIPGREFTVDVIVDRSKSVVCASPRWRLATKGGISTSAETFSDPRVLALVEDTMEALGYEGTCCLQGFLTDDDHAICIEVNPRFGGGVSLSIAAGADIATEVVRLTLSAAMHPEQVPAHLVAQPGIRMTRYFDEVYSDGQEQVRRCA